MTRLIGPRFAIVPDSVLFADVSPTAKVLWAFYARHADPEGGCYPGVEHAADLLGISHDTVQRAKAELVAADPPLIETARCFDSAGRRKNDRVTLCADYTLTRKSACKTNTQKSPTLTRKSASYKDNKDSTKPVELKRAREADAGVGALAELLRAEAAADPAVTVYLP